MTHIQEKLQAGRAKDLPPMHVAIAGLGFGSMEFISSLERLPQIEIVAGADLRPQALDAFKTRYGGRTQESVE